MSSKSDPEIHWGYEGDRGPGCWGDLSPSFVLCKSGREQSPIDIPSTTPVNPADLVFDYAPSALHIVNNGHSIQANYDPGSGLEADGERYELVQFHFHNPSENTVDGMATEMEMHLVHQNGQGEIAVVGVFLVEGAENKAYAPVFDHMPDAPGDPVDVAGVARGCRCTVAGGSQLLALGRVADDAAMYGGREVVDVAGAGGIVRGTDSGVQGIVHRERPAGAADECA